MGEIEESPTEKGLEDEEESSCTSGLSVAEKTTTQLISGLKTKNRQ